MSKVRLYGDTSGYVDLAAPAVADDATLTLPTGAAGFGKVLQVVSTTKTDPFSLTSATYTDVTGLTVSITPTSASNKVLAFFTIQGVGTIGGTVGFWRAVRDATAIGVGTGVSSRVAASGGFDVGANNQGIYSGSLTILDSPATTSAVTYKVQIRNQGSSTVYVNRTEGDADSADSVRSVSSITVMEVAT